MQVVESQVIDKETIKIMQGTETYPMDSVQAKLQRLQEKYENAGDLEKQVDVGLDFLEVSLHYLRGHMNIEGEWVEEKDWRAEIDDIVEDFGGIQTDVEKRVLLPKLKRRLSRIVAKHLESWRYLGFVVDAEVEFRSVTRSVSGGIESTSFAIPRALTKKGRGLKQNDSNL